MFFYFQRLSVNLLFCIIFSDMESFIVIYFDFDLCLVFFLFLYKSKKKKLRKKKSWKNQGETRIRNPNPVFFSDPKIPTFGIKFVFICCYLVSFTSLNIDIVCFCSLNFWSVSHKLTELKTETATHTSAAEVMMHPIFIFGFTGLLCFEI